MTADLSHTRDAVLMHCVPMDTREPKFVVEELFRRTAARALHAVDELVAEDMINLAAGTQGREGWQRIIPTITTDRGDVTIDHHHLIAEGDLVAHHMTMHGRHRSSTMPLLSGADVTNLPVSWTYIHI